MSEGKRKKWWTEEGDLRQNGRGEFIEIMEAADHADPRLVLCEVEPDETFKGVTDQQRTDFQMIVDDHNSHDQLVKALKPVHRQRPQKPVCGNDGDDGIYKLTLTGKELRAVSEALKAAGEEV